MRIRLKYNAPVVLTFAIVSGLVLILLQTSGSRELTYWFVTGRRPLDNIQTWVTMFTYVLGHSSVDHYLSNMMLFLLTGPGIEEKYGSVNTLIIIAATTLTTAVINFIVGDTGLIGCSGIVFAFIVLSSMTSFEKGQIPITMLVIVGLYLFQEVYQGLTIEDGISHLGHIIGGIMGIILGFVFNNKSQSRWQE